jgi:PAS domain-containing protein
LLEIVERRELGVVVEVDRLVENNYAEVVQEERIVVVLGMGVGRAADPLRVRVEERRPRVIAIIVAVGDERRAGRQALPPETTELMLVADDQGRYVAATQGVARVLGYELHDLIGRRVSDIAAPDLADQTPARVGTIPGRRPAGWHVPPTGGFRHGGGPELPRASGPSESGGITSPASGPP